MRIIISIFLILFLSGCENIKYTEIEKPNYKSKEYIRGGFLPWSSNKSFHVSGVGM